MSHKKIAVFGAGAMGSGIAHAFAAASIDVILIDVTSDLVAQGIRRIEGRCASDAKRGKLSFRRWGPSWAASREARSG